MLVVPFAILGFLTSGAMALGPMHKRAVTDSSSAANGKTFDYIVIGGGLAGITVASRLAEDSSVTVLLVEAGADNRNDPRIYDIQRYGEFFNTDLDWRWGTDQGRQISGGRTLGGGSSINGGAFTRGLNAQYDAMGALLEAGDSNGWNWDSVSSYMRKSERFSAPNDEQASRGAQSVGSYHGYDGPVDVTFPANMYGGPQQKAFIDTIVGLTGINHSKDLNGGAPNCVSMTPLMINWHNQGHRSSSASSYLTPVENTRTNLVTLTEHMVLKINWKAGSVPRTADGIDFSKTSAAGTTLKALARREVIIAAGAIQSPALLQLSGVGDPAVLGPLGIPVIVNLPTVGRNLQEQPMSVLGAQGNGFDFGGQGPSNTIAYPNLSQVFGPDKVGAAAAKIRNSIPAWAAAQAGNGRSAAALEVIYNKQADLIINNNAPVVELFYDNGYPDAIGILVWALLPFSRGSVLINSANPWAKPQVKVNYFSVDFDLDVQVAGSRLARKILSTPPLSDLSAGETLPGSKVPDGANRGSDAQWASWIRDEFTAVAHPVGSCAMMRRSIGGVVDGKLKVYDTTNVRVVDASTLALQVSAHLSATVYGVAEKAADLIKASW